MSWGNSALTRSLLKILNLTTCVKLRSFLPLVFKYTLCIFFFFFCEISTAVILADWMVFHRSLRLCSLFFILFLFFRLSNFSFPFFKFVYCSGCSDLRLRFCSIFFISVILLFSISLLAPFYDLCL